MGFRRFILHRPYPFVSALVDLAGDVRGRLPGALLSYAADRSEHHSDRGGDDVRFHLDPLWSSPSIDFVGIDNYLPLADWRPAGIMPTTTTPPHAGAPKKALTAVIQEACIQGISLGR